MFFRAAFVDRRICLKKSKDLIHWTQPRIILQPGANYNDGFTGMQHYAMTGNWFDGIFYGLVWRYCTSLYDKDFSRMYGFMEPELVYSYDGSDFLYTSGEALVERPFPPESGCAGLEANDICESADGQYYFIYMTGVQIVHGTEASNVKLMKALEEHHIHTGSPIYRIRKDGFCGIESVGHGGQVITKGIELLKDDLSFNIRANVGFVRFGLMSLDGSFLQGFAFDDCVPFEYDDGVDVRPQWKEHSLSEVLHRQVRIAIELNTAILHCISATARPYVYQAQKSFADPMGVADEDIFEEAPTGFVFNEE